MIISMIGFAAMLILIFAGVPLGFALMFVGLVGFAYVRADMVGQALISWGDAGLEFHMRAINGALVMTGQQMYDQVTLYSFTVIPLFILDPETEALGAAPKWRLGLSVDRFAGDLAAIGSRLVLRRGAALPVIEALAAETGAAGVMWQRMYDPAAKARDTDVKAALKARGLIAESHAGALLFEPWDVQTGQGGYYKVYSPFWRAVSGRDVAAPLPAPSRLRAPSPTASSLGAPACLVAT